MAIRDGIVEMSTDQLDALMKECRGAVAASRRGEHAKAKQQLSSLWRRSQTAVVDDAKQGADFFHRLAEAGAREEEWQLAERASLKGIELERMVDRPIVLRNSLMFVAQLLARRGAHTDAYRYGDEARKLYEADLGPDHGEVVHVRSFLSGLRAR